MNPLKPQNSRLIPTRESRAFHAARNRTFTPDKFESYTDWFYFIHIDPYTRALHAFGMVVGTLLYVVSLYRFLVFGARPEAFLTLSAGAFFFYVFPLLSHYVYDGGGARSTPGKFLPTLLPVIHINLLTLTGRFDSWLRRFVEKYPFTVAAWALREDPEGPRGRPEY
jgi:hypothetical protein